MRSHLPFFAFMCAVHAAPQVKFGLTTVLGTDIEPAGVEFFGGLPYAVPPTGSQLLRPPVLLNALAPGIFHAENFGPACLQAGLPPTAVSLDCLTINIFRPAGSRAGDNLPVMLWLYGGGFFAGSSSQASYNGTQIVSYSAMRRTPVIFASLNYRLGPLGFPQGIEAGQRNIVNLGLQDQLVGLQWLKLNSRNFGGDPSKITVFGQSAGATSISFLLLQATLGSLARAVIIESSVMNAVYGPERNEGLWQSFVASVPGCAAFVNTTNTFDCLRQANSTSLLAAVSSAGRGFSPVIDGPGGIIPDRPSQVIPKTRLPILIGTNLDEATVFSSQNISSVQPILNFLRGFQPSLLTPAQQNATIDKILRLYPDIPALGSPFGTGNNTFGLNSMYKRFNAIWGDVLLQAPRRSFTQSYVKSSGKKLFVYHFSDHDAVPLPGLAMPIVAPGSLGVAHSSDVPYVFNRLQVITPGAITLSGIMQDYWISFVTNLDPNDVRGHHRPLWPQYTARNQVLLELNSNESHVDVDTFRREQIAFLQDNNDFFHR